MTAAGVLVYTLESARIDSQRHRADRPGDRRVPALHARASTPRAGQPSPTRYAWSSTSSRATCPTTTRCWCATTASRRASITKNRYGEDFLEDPDYLAAVADLLAEGGTVESQASAYGEVWVTAVPVRSATAEGALVIANFLDDEHAELNRTLRTYAIVALLSLGLITVIAALAGGPAARAAAHLARDRPRHHRDRPVPPDPRDGQRRHHRPDPHVQRDAGPAGGRRSTGQRRFLDDAGHELRTPLTVVRGHLELLDDRQPRGRRAHPRAAAGRGGPDVTPGRRPDPARQGDRPDFVHAAPGRAGELTVSVMAKARALGDRDVGARRRRRGQRCASTSSGSPRRCSSSPTTRSSTPARRRDRHRVGVRRHGVRALGARHRAGVPPEDRRASSSASAGPRSRQRRGLRPRAVHRPAIAEAHGGTDRVTDAEPPEPASRSPCPDEEATLARILIVEDEARIASFVAKGLRAEGHAATGSRRRPQGLDEALCGSDL